MVKCDLCGHEFANSEEVKRHKEQEHPMGDEGEQPDLMQTEESDMREPAERPNG